MALTLAEALRLDPPRPTEGRSQDSAVVAFVGAGGKTTAMFQLARELPAPVLVSASTHLGVAQVATAGQHIIATDPNDLKAIRRDGVTVVTGEPGDDGRTAPVSEVVLQRLQAQAAQWDAPLLIEADGSRQKPLKAPADHEPPIPPFTKIVVVVAGMSGVGQELTDKVVHRSDLFAEICGLSPGSAIPVEALARVLTDANGGLKNIPAGARRVALLNQADTAELQAAARRIVPELLKAFEAVIIASLAAQRVHAVHERTAGILLAAGGSRRFGKVKQLLEWRGQTFVRAVAMTALSAGLSPMIVVTGAEADEVENEVSGLEVIIARNENWHSGQASSVRRGLEACERGVGSAVFLLADQPQVTPGILTSLMEAHAADLGAIWAPLIQENRRGNPVLFDRVTFEALRKLTGDEGGRAIFRKFPVEYLPWNDKGLLLDVDTEDDYRRLKETYGP